MFKKSLKNLERKIKHSFIAWKKLHWLQRRLCHLWFFRRNNQITSAVWCVWTLSTWGKRVPLSSNAKIGFRGIPGLSLPSLFRASSRDGLEPIGRFMISSKLSFCIDIPFSSVFFSGLRLLSIFMGGWCETIVCVQVTGFPLCGDCVACWSWGPPEGSMGGAGLVMTLVSWVDHWL